MTREIKNIGTVIINDPIIKDQKIALVMPVKTMSDKLQVIIDTLVYNTNNILTNTSFDIELQFFMKCNTAINNTSCFINITANYEDELNFYKREYEEIEISLNQEDSLFFKTVMLTALTNVFT